MITTSPFKKIFIALSCNSKTMTLTGFTSKKRVFLNIKERDAFHYC